MRQLAIRILKRGILVGVALAILGYFLAQAWLTALKLFGGTVHGSSDRALWTAPITLALIGVGLLVVLELITFALRRKPPQPPASTTDANPPANP
jgi:hypothetical protein